MSEYRERMASYRRATRPSSAAEARVRARLSVTEAAPSWGLRVGYLGAVGVAGLALFFAFRPAAPVPVAQTFHEGSSGGEARLGPEVTAQVAGVGEVKGDSKHLHVAWQNGSISFEVEPERGIELAVQTDEALVRVVGTGFDVVRDALGTRVQVRHGKVQVECVGGVSALLGTGESASCLPQTAGGMLGRARALGDRGDSAADQLVAVERGLALAAAGPVRDELRFLRLGLLIRGDRSADALTLAETMLRDGQSLRRSEILEAALHLRTGQGDCVGAAPWMEELRATAGSVPVWASAACPGPSTP